MRTRVRRISVPTKTKTTEVITVRSNASQVLSGLAQRLNQAKERIHDKLLRTIAVTELAEVKHRIHVEGKKSDDSQIGTYKPSYLKRRVKKPYNRTGDSKIVASLTRKMENEFVVIATPKGYGLGWLDAAGEGVSNKEKSDFLEQRFGKIYSLTKREKSLIPHISEQFIKEELRR